MQTRVTKRSLTTELRSNEFVRDIDQAIRIIQRMERARQGCKRFKELAQKA